MTDASIGDSSRKFATAQKIESFPEGFERGNLINAESANGTTRLKKTMDLQQLRLRWLVAIGVWLRKVFFSLLDVVNVWIFKFTISGLFGGPRRNAQTWCQLISRTMNGFGVEFWGGIFFFARKFYFIW